MNTRFSRFIKATVAIPIVTALIMLPMMTKASLAMKNDKDLTTQIDQMLTNTFKVTEPGAAVIVMRDGQVILRKGYGLANLELGVPVAPEMVFRLGSITKQFTAVSILMLAEAGKLALSDDVTKYLPDYPTHGQSITLENLLTHTGGVKDLEFLPARLAVARQDLTPTELIALFKDEPLDFAPGTQWAYSNSGYILLGAIIEKVSGLSYAEFVQQRIFTPLGMEHSSFDNPTQLIAGRVAGYARTEEGFANAEFMSLTQPYAVGALASSLDDLAKWDAALYSDKLLKQATLQRAFQSATLKNGRATGYGYGWAAGNYLGHSINEHNGGINGFSTQMIRLPADKVYVAILSNCENCGTPLGSLAFKIAAMLIGKPYQDPTAITLPPSALAAYPGVYQLNEKISIVIRQEGDHLTLQAGGPPRPFFPLSPTEFFRQGTTMRIKFVKNATGVVSELQFQERFGAWLVAQKSDSPLPGDRVAIQLDPALYAQYVGEYQIAPGFSLTVSVVDGKLFGQPTGEEKAELFAESETRFFLTVVDAQVEFVKDATGKVTGLVLVQGGQGMPGKKIK